MLVAAALSGVAVVGTQVRRTHDGAGATVAGAVAGATVVAGATAVLDVAGAAGATAAWAGGRVALPPVPRSALRWRPLTTTIRFNTNSLSPYVTPITSQRAFFLAYHVMLPFDCITG